MTSPVPAPASPSPRQPGRLGRVLLRMLMKQARIVQAESIAEGFRLITLESPEFDGQQWTPGQKVQIAMGSAFVARTFTPIDWNTATRQTRILGYAHGNGPGSEWIRRAQAGQACDVFGPRASLDGGDPAGLRVVFGDETSIGLAHALGHRAPDNPPRCLFEVNALAPAREALARLDLRRTELFPRTENEAHLQDLERRLAELASAGATFLLTGKAPSIQRLRRCLKALGTPASRIASKAYWAPGKTGLD